MKLFKICILSYLCILIFAGCEKSNEGRARNMLFGKNITIMVAEDEVVDAAYLKKVLNNETSKDIPFFDMWNKTALLNLTEYLERNDYIVVPGKYVINQAWGFEEGYIIVGDEKQEILKFKSKNK